MHPGCVDVHVWSLDPDLLIQDSGNWRVYDGNLDTSYCVQAIAVAPCEMGYSLRVSTLGEPRLHQLPGDDDYLVLPGRDPVPVTGLLVADSQCPRGLHVRCEIKARHLCTINLEWAESNEGDVAPQMDCELPLAGFSRRWPFADLRVPPHRREGAQDTTVNAKIVRLKQRATMNCRFHIGMEDADVGQAVLIGHIQSSESWASVPNRLSDPATTP